MNIALLAPLWKKIPPDKYGGSELVVANLAKGLSDLGHRVTTFACGGSRVAGKLVSVIDRPMYDMVGGFDWNGIKPYEFLSFFELAKRVKDFDIIHNHMDLHPIAFAPLLPIPMVTTLHSSRSPNSPLVDAFCGYPFISISNAQRILAPSLHYIATIYHGIDVNTFSARIDGKGNGFVFLGTLSSNKGIDIAVRTAHTLGMPLVIAGEMRKEDEEFLEKEVFPFVDGKHIRFVGEVNHKEKATLLREADALLFPSRWNEAFGLVMIEALACGTPVVALGNGAVPEVLENGVTGFIANDEPSFTKAALHAGELSRSVCRKEAETRFNLSVMANNYADIFQTLINRPTA